MPCFSSVYPSATQVFPLCLCKRYATEPVHPPGGCHVPTRMRERLVYKAVSADVGWCSCTAGQYVPAREWRAASVADDTRDCSDAWPAWCEGSGGLVVRESARQDVCCFGTTRRRAASRRRRHRGGRRARWRRACSVLCDCRALATAGAPGTGKNPVQRDTPESALDLLVLFRAGAAVRKSVRCARSAECELQLPVRKFPQVWWKSREEIW
jgi:hypothetical protein